MGIAGLVIIEKEGRDERGKAMSVTRIACYGGCGNPIAFCKCEKDKGNELLRCPFCGGKAGIEENIYNSVRPNDFSVGCDGEDCKTIPFTRGSSREKAIMDWNFRTKI